MSLGDEAGVSTGVTVRVEDGIVYTIIIEHPEEPVRSITALAIDGATGVIDQEAQTITFTVPEDRIINGRFAGTITELVANNGTIYFWVALKSYLSCKKQRWLLTIV